MPVLCMLCSSCTYYIFAADSKVVQTNAVSLFVLGRWYEQGHLITTAVSSPNLQGGLICMLRDFFFPLPAEEEPIEWEEEEKGSMMLE
jgi:hypothetical protein